MGFGMKLTDQKKEGVFLFPKGLINIAIFTNFVGNFKFRENDSRSRRGNRNGWNHHD